ncbi:MAG TPA: glutamine synthetase family protein [Actinomycetota bacterium]|nr:glutamine synthetase family protein [Actinomycetota bacterium]
MDGLDEAERARQLAEELGARGVNAVALTWVDNAGIARVKAVPTERLVDAVIRGVGMSPVFDVFVVDDSITTSTHIGGPVGDLRLFPDLNRLTPLVAQPGWAWAAADRRTQEGEPYAADQRRFASRLVEQAAAAGLAFRMAFEVEWFVGRDEGDGTTPACAGPAYGMIRVVELSGYVRDVLAALAGEGVPVDQFHPEYAPGQLELSVAAADPVAAADRLVLVKQTIRAVAQTHGLRASFAPVVVAGQVGNGCHLHLSAWSEGRNLFAGGDGPHGLSRRGESVVAGLLDHLPALSAIGAPSVASYLRMVPQHWAGAYQCWGRENREAAIRLIAGTPGFADWSANIELKCVDASANPYLVVGAVVAVAITTVDEGLRLPPEVTTDPASLRPELQPPRLPVSLGESVDRLARDRVLAAALGDELREAFLAVRRAEIDLFAGKADEQIVAATRWKH